MKFSVRQSIWFGWEVGKCLLFIMENPPGKVLGSE